MPHPKPVERIELSEKHIKLRIALVILFAVIGIGAIAYALLTRLNAESGWVTIEADASSSANCAGEFVFRYFLGAGEVSPTAEQKAVTALYSEAAEKACQLFDAERVFGVVHNLYYINQHPNEEIEVDEVLYRAFEICKTTDSRALYLAPLYGQYNSLFFCNEDYEAESFDPYRNPDLKAEFQQYLAYAQNPEAVNLELLGDNRVMLKVSGEFMSYFAENWGGSYIDFGWMKNAFIIDYFADVMKANGYTMGSFSSYDGFVRNLDESGLIYAFNLYDRVDKTVYQAAVMEYSQPISIVYLRDYPANSPDAGRFYEYENGEIRVPYVDSGDGLCKSAEDSLVSYSTERGCADILMKIMPAYIADEFNPEGLWSLAGDGVYSIYSDGGMIYCNDAELTLTDLYEDVNVRYEVSPVK